MHTHTYLYAFMCKTSISKNFVEHERLIYKKISHLIPVLSIIHTEPVKVNRKHGAISFSEALSLTGK